MPLARILRRHGEQPEPAHGTCREALGCLAGKVPLGWDPLTGLPGNFTPELLPFDASLGRKEINPYVPVFCPGMDG